MGVLDQLGAASQGLLSAQSNALLSQQYGRQLDTRTIRERVESTLRIQQDVKASAELVIAQATEALALCEDHPNIIRLLDLLARIGIQ